jgi:hypothetical protein
MTLSKDKKIEYIVHVLQETMKGSIEAEDSVLVEIALIFIEDLKEKEDIKN